MISLENDIAFFLTKADLLVLERTQDQSVLSNQNNNSRFDSSYMYRKFKTIIDERARTQFPMGLGCLTFMEISLKAIRDFGGTAILNSIAAACCFEARKYVLAIDYATAACRQNQFDLFSQKVLYFARMGLAGNSNVPHLTDEYEDLRDRFCAKPFTDFETTPNGQVFVCCPSWLPVPIGNLFDEGEIWNSRAAHEIRKSILDGSFRYCSRTNCNLIAGNSLPRRSEIAESKTDNAMSHAEISMERGPLRLTLSHDRSCNLACPSCRRDFIIAKKDEQRRLDRVLEILMPLIRDAQSINGKRSAAPTLRRVTAKG
jgi:Iron-sulfur cluster-binding domain